MRVFGVSLLIVLFLAGFPLAAQDAAAAKNSKVQESYLDRVKRTGAILEVSISDTIRLALTNNLEIEIENYNEDLNRERVFGTKGFYDPLLQFSVGFVSSERPNTSILDAGASIATTISKNLSFSSSLSQNIKGGGGFLLNFNNFRSTTNSSFTFINPQFNTNFELTFTQPLWKGFRQTQTERDLKLFNLDTELSDSQFEQRVSEIISQVQNQYWELVYSIENYETLRSSLQLAQVQLQDNQKRVEIGVMAPIEITSSRAEVAAREQDLIQSQVQIINAQNTLKGYLAPDPRNSIWNLNLIPTDRPEVRDVNVTLDEAMRTALEKRPELEQLQLELKKVDVDRAYYKKDGKPAVDLRFGVLSRGASGQVFTRALIDTDNDGVPDTRGGPPIVSPDSPLFGNFGEAWSQVFGWSTPQYTAAVNVQIPLRNRANEANLASTALTERQLLSRLKGTQQSIMVDVRNAYESIATQKEALVAASLARELSEEQLRGENKRFEAGLSTNFEVLRFQRDLADSQVRELRAKIDYQLALTALQQATFSIVDDADVVVARRDSHRGH